MSSFFKNSNSLTCGIAFAFLGGMLWIIIAANRNTMKDFESTLSPKQLVVMEDVKKMRFQIWIKGLFFGFIIALLAARFLPINLGGQNMNACAVAAIAMGINYFYYSFASKPLRMIDHLQPGQVSGWSAVSKDMQKKYHIGLILGLVGSFLLTKGLSNYTSVQAGG